MEHDSTCKYKVWLPEYLFQVDAFTESAFKGNPAPGAVCLLEEQRNDKWLQSVTTEFSLSETCFLIRTDSESPNPRFHLKWLTSVAEVHRLSSSLFFFGFYESRITIY